MQSRCLLTFQPVLRRTLTLSQFSGTRFVTTKCALYLDRAVLVINKSSGLDSQPRISQGKEKSNAGEDEVTGLLSDLKSKFELRTTPYPVHRLDKSTTGALVFALTPSHARDLSQQFSSRSAEKTYLALVRGGEKSFSEKSGVIQNPISIVDGRVSLARIKKEGKEALTEWELLSSSKLAPLSLLRLQLHTGLKHQLRVHLAHVLKTPILGDTLYASSKLPPTITEVVNVPPQLMYLHASRLSFYRYRPESYHHKRLRLGVTAPLPGSFTRICAKVGIPVPREFTEGGVYVDGDKIRGGIVEDLEGRWVG